MSNHFIKQLLYPSSSNNEADAILNPPPPSLEEIKQKLLPTGISNKQLGQQVQQDLVEPTPALSITDVKELLSPGSTLNVFQRKQQNLLNRANEKLDNVLNKNTGPAFGGIPFAALAPEDKRRAIQFNEELIQERLAQVRREKTAIFTDDQLEKPIGAIGNAIFSFGAGGARVLGETLKLAPYAINLRAKKEVSGTDINMYNQVRTKLKLNIPLTSYEEEYLSYAFENNIFQQLSIVDATQEAISTLDKTIDTFDKFVNTKNQEVAFEKLLKTGDTVKNQFVNGDYISGIASYLGGLVELAGTDTAAAVEVIVNSLPQMFVLAKSALFGVTTLTASGYDRALREFEQEHGRPANEAERALAGILVLSSASLDALGSKAVFGLKNLLKDLPVFAKTFGVRTSSKTISAAKRAVKNFVDTGKSGFVELLTEGTQDVLEQQAALQDLIQTNIPQALAASSFGGIAGAGIAGAVRVPGTIKETVSATGKTTKAVTKGAKKAAQKVAETELGKKARAKLDERAVGKTDDIVKRSIEQDKPEVGLNALSKENFQKQTEKVVDRRINQFTELLNKNKEQIEKLKQDIIDATEEGQEPDFTPIQSRITQQGEFEERLNNVLAAQVRTESDLSTQQAVEVLTETVPQDLIDEEGNKIKRENLIERTKENIEKAKENLLDAVTRTLTATKTQIKEALGSDEIEKDDVAKKYLTDYYRFQESRDKITENFQRSQKKTLDQVHYEILTGSRDGKFIGINQHLRNVQQAILNNDKEAVKQTIRALKAFRQTQIAKRDKPGNQPIFRGYLNDEVKLLTDTIQQITNIGTRHFGLKPTTKPETTEQAAGASQPKAAAQVQEKEIKKEKKISRPVLVIRTKQLQTKTQKYKNLINTLGNLDLTYIETYEKSDGTIVDLPIDAGTRLKLLDVRLNKFLQILERCA